MILKGKPNLFVNKVVRFPNGSQSPRTLFKFDADGYVEIDERRFSEADLRRYRHMFEEVVKAAENPTESLETLSYKELQKLYSDKTGKSVVGVKKQAMIDELGGLQ